MLSGRHSHDLLADGTGTEILTWLDNHSRLALPVTAHRRVSGPIVVAAFCTAVTAYDAPACKMTDNRMISPPGSPSASANATASNASY